GGALKHAVVAVIDVEDKAFVDGYKGTDIVAEFCEFLPFTGVVVKQKNFHVENHDADPDDPGPKGDFPGKKGVLHNPHTFEWLGTRSPARWKPRWMSLRVAPRRRSSKSRRSKDARLGWRRAVADIGHCPFCLVVSWQVTCGLSLPRLSRHPYHGGQEWNPSGIPAAAITTRCIPEQRVP